MHPYFLPGRYRVLLATEKKHSFFAEHDNTPIAFSAAAHLLGKAHEPIG